MKILKTVTTDRIELEGILSDDRGYSDSIIVHVCGMSKKIADDSFYQEMSQKYPENGWHFLVIGHRGIGVETEYKTEDGVRMIGYAHERFEDSIYDIDSWITKISDMGYTNIWLQSSSFGPAKVAYYMYKRKDNRVKGLIWISPSDIIGLVNDEEGKKDHDKLMPEALELVSDGKEESLLSNLLWGCKRLSAGTYVNFFADDAQTGIFNFNKIRNDWHVVNSIVVPVLAITGTNDDGITPIIDPYEAMEKLKNELTNSPKVKTIVYKGADHEFMGFDKQIVSDVLEFVDDK